MRMQFFKESLINTGNSKDFESDPKTSRHIARIGDTMLGRVRPGHSDSGHVLSADGLHGNRSNERRIDAAAQSNQDSLESALTDIVSCTEHESAIHGLMLVGEILVLIAG